MQKIIPFLWFDSNAEEAINFYTLHFFRRRRNPPLAERIQKWELLQDMMKPVLQLPEDRQVL